jgi:hypothetical protein
LSEPNETVARLHFDAPGSRSAGDATEPRLVTGVARTVLDALLEGFAAADHLRALSGVGTPPPGVTPDLLIERVPHGDEAARELRQVAEDLLRHLLDEEGLSAEELESRAGALRAAVRRSLEEGGRSPEGFRRHKAEHARLFADVGALLRELGLELFETDVALAATKSGDARLETVRVSGIAAHVRLLDRLLSRLELSLVGHELLHLERDASSWWFQKWSVDPPEGGGFARGVREQEWSLAERGTLFMGPVLDNFLGRGFASRIPVRQRRLAQALQASFAGVFVVRDRRDGTAIFQDMDTGRRIEVHEHDGALAYRAGSIGLGRLYAFDGPIHLRSPGMAMIEMEDEALAQRLAEAFRRGRRQLAPALALETLLSALTRETKLPRPILPARSPVEARQLLERATHALSGVGLVEDADEVSAEAAAAAGATAAQATRKYKVDATMGHWLGGLMDLADKAPRPGLARAKAGGKKGKRKG